MNFSYDQNKVAQFIGKSRSHVSNCLRLLNLPNEVLDLIKNNKLSQGHAKILVGLENAFFLSKKILKKNYQSDKLKIWSKFLKQKRFQNLNQKTLI